MNHLLKQTHCLLLNKHKTVAVAESCTGGLTSALLTRFSGSSAYFLLGVVVYSNRAKVKILKVPKALLEQKGAVSAEVAQKMASGVRKLAGADFGIGITGIAGPRGGTKQKPIGTVFIAIDSQKQKICRKFNLSGNRSQIRKKASLKALELLSQILQID